MRQKRCLKNQNNFSFLDDALLEKLKRVIQSKLLFFWDKRVKELTLFGFLNEPASCMKNQNNFTLCREMVSSNPPSTCKKKKFSFELPCTPLFKKKKRKKAQLGPLDNSPTHRHGLPVVLLHVVGLFPCRFHSLSLSL